MKELGQQPRIRAVEPTTSRDLVGQSFGRFKILSLIQRGGMGEIFLAEMQPLGIRVVLKRLQDGHTTDERYVEMFQNEAMVMSRLDHPNIVKVLDVPIIEDKQCLAMEFVRGRNLQQVLKRLRVLKTLMSPSIAVYIMRKVLAGLQEAHNACFSDGRPLNLVHRDIKPGNILVSFAGDVKLTDFGIAKSEMQNRMTTAGVVKGTVRYLSPEQIRGQAVDARSDLFSCASVLVEMLTDIPLYDRGSVASTLMAILNDDRRSIEQILPFRAPWLTEALEMALSPHPDDRPSSASEFGQLLLAASRELGSAVKDDDVGVLLRQLFQGTADIQVARDGEDVTYLLDNNDSSFRSDIQEQSLPEPRRKRRSTSPPPPMPPATGMYIKEDVVPEYEAAERRANKMVSSSMTDIQIDIVEPVEMEARAMEHNVLHGDSIVDKIFNKLAMWKTLPVLAGCLIGILLACMVFVLGRF